MEERRSARVGTVSGLALLAGGTAVAAVAGGRHSVFATILLGMLAVGMGHALLDEIRRQARRSSIGWARQDTVNTVMLASWAAGAITATAVAVTAVPVRAVGAALSLAYALICVFFVIERRRTMQSAPEVTHAETRPEPDLGAATPHQPHNPLASVPSPAREPGPALPAGRPLGPELPAGRARDPELPAGRPHGSDVAAPASNPAGSAHDSEMAA